MRQTTPTGSQVLPSPPSDEERDIYFQRNLWPLVLAGLLGAVGILWATVHMAISHRGMALLLPLLTISPICVLLSAVIQGRGRDERRSRHRLRLASWEPRQYPSIDVWLPVCGEPLELLYNAWNYTRALEWPGRLRFHVGDDADDPRLWELAREFGFVYHVRPDRGFMKKAGNLRHLYQNSDGDFALVFDADFCPRPDFLHQLMPYFDEPDTGIVQSPQYFRVLSEQHWLERGAGAVQEFFYRTVQTARQRWGGSAVCVGTNAIYRRRALASNGGTTLIEHSEDVHTGFDLGRHGWKLRYVPVVLATGVCPSDKAAFMRQQYRWCAGSMSLTFSRKFWQTRMSLGSRCCYLTGLGYYVTTALQAASTPVLPVFLLLAYPQMIQLGNYRFLAPALVFSYLLFPFWHRCHWGLEAWTARLLYGWAHLFAIADIARGRSMGWTPTGARSSTRRGFSLAIAWTMAMAVAWVALAADRLRERPLAFLPLLLIGTFFLACVARVYIPAFWSPPKLPPRALKRGAMVAAALLLGLPSLAPPAPGAELGIIGSPARFAELRGEGMPVQILGTWISWQASSPAPFLKEVPAEAEPMVNWEPSGVSIARIAAGGYDPYIEAWARDIAAYRKPVLIRFAQEMNGNWFSWSRYGPRAFVAAWRHIVDVFRREGAGNADFIWAPDGLIGVPSARWERSVVRWYPGSSYVGFLGMSMVAFRSNVGYGQSYFFARLDYLHRVFPNPVVLPEMKVTEPDRYRWLTSLRGALAARSWVKTLIWSETKSEAQVAHPRTAGQMDWSLVGDARARSLLRLSVAGSPAPAH